MFDTMLRNSLIVVLLSSAIIIALLTVITNKQLSR